MHALLRHLEEAGFTGAPRLVDSGLDQDGRETLTFAAIVDGYGLPTRQRRGFLDQIIEFAICDTAAEADDADITRS